MVVRVLVREHRTVPQNPRRNDSVPVSRCGESGSCEIASDYRVCSVVVSHPLHMRKPSGSIPDVSTFHSSTSYVHIIVLTEDVDE